MNNVCVVGLGYVGLPLVINASLKGVQLDGYDVDANKVSQLSHGRCYLEQYRSDFLDLDLSKHNFFSNSDNLKLYSTLIICVPTPVSQNRTPDHSYVDSVISELIAIDHLPSLVVLESTVAPGYTRSKIVSRLEAAFSKVCGRDFHVCFSPEREDPGNKTYTNLKIPKVVGGFGASCYEACFAVYSSIFDSLVRASSLEVAELTKLHENTFRAVNIAYVNQLRDLAVSLDINAKEVIDLASSKPFGFTRFDPSNGVGGHCIPVDPYFLIDKFSQNNIITDAMKYIESLPYETFLWLDKTIPASSHTIILGLGYKDGVDDLRNSPNFELLKLLSCTRDVGFYDPKVQAADEVVDFKSFSIDQVSSGNYAVVVSSPSGAELVRQLRLNEYYDVRYRQKVNRSSL